jgi:AbrB family looped-hinge helix DNA binding protein
LAVNAERGVITMLRETVRFKKKAQITIPKAIVDELNLHEDDLLEARLEDGRIVLVPTVAVPKDQAWYWTEEWQREEREVDEQISTGKATQPMELDEALSVLDGLMKRDGQ